ncbi:hypothetical protein Cni_G19712 [Canna indica]|uniref:Pectinesterase inhibitor domain-containing protein n=1 Tax=Canna indica TaxID=4628 RepID=A0AAQ3KS62_9LILI|nr:hypothetical protein Cni_G19712 [Canna indica]
MDDIVDDLKVWLSAAVTYQETCLDRFQNTSGDAAASMTKALNSSSMLTSNTLAIVDQMSTVLTSFQLPSLSRRLLVENEVSDRREFPEWFHHERRRLLALSPQEMKPDAAVVQDGSRNYKTISEAIAAAPEKKALAYVKLLKYIIFPSSPLKYLICSIWSLFSPYQHSMLSKLFESSIRNIKIFKSLIIFS